MIALPCWLQPTFSRCWDATNFVGADRIAETNPGVSPNLFHLDQANRAGLHLDIDRAGEEHGPLAMLTVDIKN
jgi:hypothetical protein